MSLTACQHLSQEGQSNQGSSRHSEISGFTHLLVWDAKYLRVCCQCHEDLTAVAKGADASPALAFLQLLLSYGRGDLSPNKLKPELSVHSYLNLTQRW